MKRKIVSLFLCLCMVMTMVPWSGFADEVPPLISAVEVFEQQESEEPLISDGEQDVEEVAALPEDEPEEILTVDEVAPESDIIESEIDVGALDTEEYPETESVAEPEEIEENSAGEVIEEVGEVTVPYVPGYQIQKSVMNGIYLWAVPDSGDVTQGFKAGVHNAIDIAAAYGTDVIAIADGTISNIQHWDGITVTGNQSYGNMVELTTADGVLVRYAHFSEINVSVGDTVAAGQFIAKIGSTGKSTGNHLHIEILKNGVYEDPKLLMTGNNSEMLLKLQDVLDRFGGYIDESGQLRAIGGGEYLKDGGGSIYDAMVEIGYIAPVLFRASWLNQTVEVTSQNLSTAQVQFADGDNIVGWYAKRANGAPAYCIQKGAPLNPGSNTGYTATEVSDAFAVRASLIDYYGRHKGNGSLKNELYVQLMIWEIQGSSPLSMNDVNGWGNSVSMTEYNAFKAAVNAKVNTFYDKPSFENQTVTLRVGESITLTDTKGSFAYYEDDAFSNSANVSIVKNGNQVKITANANSNSSGVLRFIYDIEAAHAHSALYYTNTETQDAMTCGVSDPIRIDINIRVLKDGNLRLVKTSEDGIVAAMQFLISGNGQNWTKTTEADGILNVTGMPVYDSNNQKIQYTATEVSVPGRYVQPASQTFTLTENTTTTITFSNVLKKSGFQLVKISEDGIVEGMTFSFSGNGQTWTDITGVGGIINTAGLAVYDSNNQKIQYTATEVSTPGRYVQPSSQTFTLTENATTTINFSNILKKWHLTVTKQDGETTNAQGDATLAGAVYGIYKGGVLQDSYTIDANNQFTTKTYYCDTDFTLQEITPAPGYQLDTTVYAVGMHPGSTTIELNPMSKTVTEQVIKGKIQIHKFLELLNGGQISGKREPEPDAVFELYLTSAGSYAAAGASERDLLTTDTDGRAISKDLPYGWYTVHQIDGNPSYSFAPDFQVFINEHGKTYVYYIGNAGIYAQMKIIKKDAGTGKIIPFAGTGFKIKNEATGEFVEQTLTYPSNQKISEFYTNAEGWLILPEPLLKGKYALYEILAPEGYVIAEDPIYFTVDGNSDIVEVVMENVPQMGRIEIGKTGEMLSTIVEQEGIYQPVYSVVGLPNAVYDIIAAEDIVTLDGTVRAKAGDVVDTVITDTDGKAISKSLYLGEYKAIEKKAPEGFVLDDTPIFVSLEYVGQTVEITTVKVGHYDERQKVEVSLNKVMEQDVIFGLGMNDELQDVSFGLYASVDISALDSTVIPADGLIEQLFLSADKKMRFGTDLPHGSYYLKEITTNGKYVLSDEKYLVEFAYQGQEIASVAIMANDGQAIENKLLRGKVQLLKVDAEDYEKLLSGAEFAVYLKLEEDILIGNMSEPEAGRYELDNLAAGSYYLKEIKAPESYLPDEEVYSFEITADGETVVIENEPGVGFTNWHVPEIHTTATIDGEKVAVTGETVTITDTVTYYHLQPGKEYTLLGVVMDKALNARFVVDGKEVPVGQTFQPESSTGEIALEYKFDARTITAETDLTIFERLYDGKVLWETADKHEPVTVHEDIEDEGQTVKLIPLLGSVEGKKVDENGKGLEGALIGIFAEGEKEYTKETAIMTALSASNGSFLFLKLTYGKYQIREISAPQGYQLTDKVITVEVNADGQVIQVEILNKLIPEVPQTGDSPWIFGWVLTFALSMISVGTTLIVLHHRRKKDSGNAKTD